MAVASPRPLLDQPTVIVLRALPGMGDWLCAVPTLRALRAARPDARIHLVGLGATRSLVGRYPELVDGFHAFPGWPGLPEQPLDAGAIPGFLAALQGLEADLAIQLHGSGETTNELVQLFGAASIAGFYRPGADCPDPSRFLPWQDTDPEVGRGLRLLTLLGLEAEDASLSFPVSPDAIEDGDRLLRTRGIGDRFVVVHPGGHTRANRWPVDGFGRVGREIATLGWQIVVTGEPAEAELTASVARAIPGAVDLGGETSLDAMAAVVQRATLVVTNDTGVSHLADALRVPSVVVFANDDGTRRRRWAPLDATLHQPVHATVDGAATRDVAVAARRLLTLGGRVDGAPASQSGAVT
jgi:ADP-heptose:LPS heptosyltransferase